MDLKGLWQAVLGELEVSMSRANFSTWFRQTAIIANDDGHVVIGVPNIFTKEWLEKKYHANIKTALAKLVGNVTTIEYKVGSIAAADTPAMQLSELPASHAPAEAQPARAEREPRSLPKMAPAHTVPVWTGNPRYTFDNFVVGSSNELAYAAAQAVTKFPGTKYNPLFLYGGVGLGKTHLLQAVGNEVLRQDPDKKVAYVTCEEFTNEFLGSLSKKKTQEFAGKYRRIDVLIVDDMQFLAGKERTQEEFFHTFNALHQASRQIILSSDRPPQALTGLEDRLRSRFASGMMADIGMPDLETRSVILQRKAAAQGVLLPLEVIDYIARHVVSNIRELEGALTQFMAHCEFHHLEPSLATATSLLGGRIGSASKSKTLTPRLIIDKVSVYFDLTPVEITGSKRDKEIVVPRQIAMYLMRHELSLSFPKIAAAVGGRDHTTAMHSVAKIEKQLEADEDLRTEVQTIKERLRA